MASFTVRVELKGDAPTSVYGALHHVMMAANFFTVVRGDDGNFYHLPSAEYTCSSQLSAVQLRDYVSGLVSSLWLDHWIFVTQAGDRAWRTERIIL